VSELGLGLGLGLGVLFLYRLGLGLGLGLCRVTRVTRVLNSNYSSTRLE